VDPRRRVVHEHDPPRGVGHDHALGELVQDGGAFGGERGGVRLALAQRRPGGLELDHGSPRPPQFRVLGLEFRHAPTEFVGARRRGEAFLSGHGGPVPHRA
jgi:hypothetical protein